TYTYDPVNRLTTAASSHASNKLGETLTYDKMGNIQSLARGNYGSLAYTYDGNRLSSVSGFKTGSFGYDANGNTTTDGTRNLTITYNELNLPSQVTGNGTATYTYDATGNKIRSVQAGTTRDYIAGIQYTNGTIDFIQTEEGRAVRNTDGTYRYEYDLKDHLGNTRVSTDAAGNVIQEDEYYAFGLNAPVYAAGTKNKYLYNGKEIQDVLTDQYDYGARFYDPLLGRWNAVDPLAEKFYLFSPYNYGLNNPMIMVDPDGRATSPIYDTNGDFLGTDDQGLKGQAIVMNKSNFTQGMNHDEAVKNSTYKEGDPNYGFISEKAALKYANHYIGLKNRPDYDGKLTLSEANEWYRTGGGKPLFVDASKIDLTPVYEGDLSVGDSKYVNFASPANANFETGLVYGTIKLTLVDGSRVRLGGDNGVLDIYDFDYQKGRTGRNVATWMGKTVAGEGAGYTIYNYGMSHLKKKPQ
ncbi:RHS repeat domain-containing protein, partial [Pararcticibacter amylolyticus]